MDMVCILQENRGLVDNEADSDQSLDCLAGEFGFEPLGLAD